MSCESSPPQELRPRPEQQGHEPETVPEDGSRGRWCGCRCGRERGELHCKAGANDYLLPTKGRWKGFGWVSPQSDHWLGQGPDNETSIHSWRSVDDASEQQAPKGSEDLPEGSGEDRADARVKPRWTHPGKIQKHLQDWPHCVPKKQLGNLPKRKLLEMHDNDHEGLWKGGREFEKGVRK